MRIFVTGHRDYIDSHLVELLREEGFHVIGCDLNLFDNCESFARVPANEELVKDVRLSLVGYPARDRAAEV